MATTKFVKVITLTAQATESHTNVKVNNIIKWLKSGHDVKVLITGRSDRQKQMESIYHRIEKDTRIGSRLLQKVTKPESIKFILQSNEGAANLIVDDITKTRNEQVDDNMDAFALGKDIFSEEFEKELDNSIKEELFKNKKK